MKKQNYQEYRLAFIEASDTLSKKQMENYAKSQARMCEAHKKRVAENPEFYEMVEKAIASTKQERENINPQNSTIQFLNFKLLRKYARKFIQQCSKACQGS